MKFNSITLAAATALALSAGMAQAVTVNAFANGGFETLPSVAGQFAQGWRGVNGAPGSLSTTVARTGSNSGQLRVPDPGFNGSGLVQNSVDDGMLAALDPSNWGTAPTLSFWALGNASITGNVNYSLRYLNSTGSILNPVVNTSFGGLINPNTWTQITLAGTVIPVNTTAVFLEMTLATGPTGVTTNPDGTVTDYGQARIWIDDITLNVTAVPEPGTYALLLAGLGIVGAVARRRRSV